MDKPLFTLPDVLAATGGTLASGPENASFSRVVIDSRAVKEGDLFVAIRGERFDGHDFIGKAAAAGAAGVAASAPPKPEDAAGAAVVLVNDTTAALGDLGAFHRKRLSVSVVGITGTNGKSSTKEMTAAVLGQKFATAKNPGNYNNCYGVPLTLLSLAPETRWAVVEMGMNHPGEIALLAKMAAPDVGVVTNVGPGHLEGLGTVEGVAAAKEELLAAMPGKTAVLNADDPRVRDMASRYPGKVVLFGADQDAHVRFHSLSQEPDGLAFALGFPEGEVRVKLFFHGRCMAANAAAAAAVGWVAGMDPEDIRAGLCMARPMAGRLCPVPLRDRMVLVDDSYNANPASMAAAMETLCSLGEGGRCVLVAGEMAELGEGVADWHREVGRLAAAYQMDALYVTGPYADHVAAGAMAAGMEPPDIVVEDKQTLVARLQAELRPGDRVLVKGSRRAGMDEVAEKLARFFKP
ncbi:MAG: UDP-N-acetylmuramoyl-tripeptide--D-alanyl-D-alanine ligase [Deltaproteobacteria bacterium]|nr:UDP-N-acetylmuramoyl-tripeptide--D-alanyl-D-alanine ligase [Deltaproteobacteria bacterium]